MQVAEENEPKDHLKARLRVEQYFTNNGYEIIDSNKISCNVCFFGEPFRGILGRFGSRWDYVHSYDIVAKKEFSNYGKNKHTLFTVIEIDGWDSRHGENASKRTRAHQIKKDLIAAGVFKLFSDIIKLCNRETSIDFDFIRVRKEQIFKCKTDEDVKKCFIAAAGDDYLWTSSEIR